MEQVLHKQLPDSYNRVLFKKKCDAIFETMLNYAAQGRGGRRDEKQIPPNPPLKSGELIATIFLNVRH